MPPRPPLTTLVIHTWKEHGKPRPLSNHQQSTQAARDRISRSLSHDANLTRHLRSPSLDDDVTNQHRIPAVVSSASVEDALHLKNRSPVAFSSPVSTPTDDDSDTFGLPLLPRCISTPETPHSSVREAPTTPAKANPETAFPRIHIALPPLPREWPLCSRRARRVGGSVLVAGPPNGKARRVRARSVGAREFQSSLLGESLIQGSSSFHAGLSDIASRGIVQTGIAQNV